jgi:hypothetical protein
MNLRLLLLSVLLGCIVVFGVCGRAASVQAENIYDAADDFGNWLGDMIGSFVRKISPEFPTENKLRFFRRSNFLTPPKTSFQLPKDFKLKCNDGAHDKIQESLKSQGGYFFCICPMKNARQGKCKTMDDKKSVCADPRYGGVFYAVVVA